MLDAKEKMIVFENAYVPEHVHAYGEAASGGEAFFHDGYLCYVRERHALLIGFPLVSRAVRLPDAIEGVRRRFKKSAIVVVAQDVRTIPGVQCDEQSVDWYSRLPVPLGTIDSGNAYMVRRAQRDLRVVQGVFGDEHELLIRKFFSERSLDDAHREILRRIPRYVMNSATALLIEARHKDQLVAFDIIDGGAFQYLFYMFNFRDSGLSIPGASDLLFWEMTQIAHKQGKKWLNLGLGINDGVRRFKGKWGGTRFLKHSVGTVNTGAGGPFKSLVDALMRMGGIC
jgi:hypothetical protein